MATDDWKKGSVQFVATVGLDEGECVIYCH